MPRSTQLTEYLERAGREYVGVQVCLLYHGLHATIEPMATVALMLQTTDSQIAILATDPHNQEGLTGDRDWVIDLMSMDGETLNRIELPEGTTKFEIARKMVEFYEQVAYQP